MLFTVDPDQPGEARPSQGDNDAGEPIESSEQVQYGLSDTVGHTKSLDSEDSSGAVSGGNYAESEEKETDAGTYAAPGSSDGGDRAPFAAVGAAVSQLRRQASSTYAVHTQEEVGELEKMTKAIVTTPRKTKRVLNMYVTSAEELGYVISFCLRTCSRR